MMAEFISPVKVLLVALHFGLFYWLLKACLRRNNFSIPAGLILGIFVLKVFVGIGYNYIHSSVLEGCDPWYRFLDARTMMGVALEDWKSFLGYFFLPESNWNMPVLRDYLVQLSFPFGYKSELPLIKLNIIANFLTGNSYYGVIPFIAFLTTGLNAWLSTLLSMELKTKAALIFLVLSLVPSVLFFTSGFYKDSFMYIAICLMTIAVLFVKKRQRIKLSILFFVISSILMLSLRWVDFVLYVPFFLLFLLFANHNKFVFFKFLSVSIFGLVLLLLVDYILPTVDLFHILDERKSLTINGFASSSFYSADWRGEGVQIVKYIPVALFNALFQPLPWTSVNGLSFLVSLESIFLITLIIYCVFIKKGSWRLTPILCLFLFLTLARLSFNGLFVENAGTIIRHRSEVLSFFILFLLLFKSDTLSRLSYFFPIKEKTASLSH